MHPWFLPQPQIQATTSAPTFMCLWLLDLIYTVLVLKVDRLFEWKRGPNSGIMDTVKKQKRNTKQEFDERVQVVLKEFSEQVSEYATSCMGDCVRSNLSVVRGPYRNEGSLKWYLSGLKSRRIWVWIIESPENKCSCSTVTNTAFCLSHEVSRLVIENMKKTIEKAIWKKKRATAISWGFICLVKQ